MVKAGYTGVNLTSSKASAWQSGLILTLRFLIGWHLLYEGISKFIHPEWSSLAFLAESRGILSGVANWIISSPEVLNAVDFMNTWGLVAIGLGLILGLFTRWAAFAGAFLLALYYLFLPPFIGLETTAPQEGNYLIVNKNLIEAVVLLLIAVSPAAKKYGLDTLFDRRSGTTDESDTEI